MTVESFAASRCERFVTPRVGERQRGRETQRDGEEVLSVGERVIFSPGWTAKVRPTKIAMLFTPLHFR